MASPSTNLNFVQRSAGGKSGSAVKAEPAEHLIQHVKQYDPMLYEYLTRLGSKVNNIANYGTLPPPPVLSSYAELDKGTFGVLNPFTVTTYISPNIYICRLAGTFIDSAAHCRIAPTGSTAIFKLMLSTDDGMTWASVWSTPYLVISSTSTVVIPKTQFAITSISVGHLLRLDCTQIGSTVAGNFLELVTRWTQTVSTS